MSKLALAALAASLGLSVRGAGPWRVDTSRKWGDWPKADSQWTVTASSGGVRLRLEAFAGLSPAELARKEQLQVSRIRLLYAGDIGYPGMVTRSLRVPAALTPYKLKRGAGRPDALILPASSRLTYGVGAEDLAAYRCALSFVECPRSGRLLQVELFYPKASFDRRAALAALDRFSCSP